MRNLTKQSISDCCSPGNSGLAPHCGGFECIKDLQRCERNDNHEPGFSASKTSNWPLLRRRPRFFPVRQTNCSRSFRTHCFPHLVRSTNRWQPRGSPFSISKRCRLAKGCRFQPPRLREATGCKGVTSMTKPSASTQNSLGPKSGTVSVPWQTRGLHQHDYGAKFQHVGITWPSNSGCMTLGSNLVYTWLPNTAAEMSNPLPTFPCARQ